MTTTLRRTISLTLVLLAAGPASLGDPSAAHAADRSCGNAALADGLHVEIRVHATTCAAGRRMLSWYSTSTGPCSGNACFRHHRGWDCGSAAFFARPRLFSCSRPSGAYAAALEMRDRVVL